MSFQVLRQQATITVLLGVLICPLLGVHAAAEVVQLEGLDAAALLLEDEQGVAHGVVGSERDAYYLLGFLHARDRFFQMDFLRHVFEGKLTEIVGQAALRSDAQYRSFDLRRAAQESYALYSPEVRRLMDAYAAGVNAARAHFPVPLEYQLLELTGSTLRPWEPSDGALMLKALTTTAWLDLSDIDLSIAASAFVEAGNRHGFDGESLFFEDVYRLAPIEPVSTVPASGGGGETSGIEGKADTVRGGSGGRALDYFSGEHLQLARELRAQLERNRWLEGTLRGSATGQGSNWWLLDGSHTRSGAPLLANDPHQFLSIPPLIYPVHIIIDRGQGFETLYGATFAGIPAVVSGCNEKICWGATNNSLDLTDTFAERVLVDPESGRPTHTVFRSQPEPVEVLVHSYRANVLGDGVADNLVDLDVSREDGGESYKVPRRNGGPLMVSGPPVDGEAAGLSIQWTGWSANRDFEAYVHLHRAKNFDSFKRALSYADGFSFNMAYADVRGNIGYLVTGELPLRQDLQELERVDGTPPFLIRDGTGESLHEWMPPDQRNDPFRSLPFAVLPQDEMPQALNPSSGILISSNNDPIGATTDNDAFNEMRRTGGVLYLNRSFVSLRAAQVEQQLADLISSRNGRLSTEDIEQLQADTRMWDAEILVPLLVGAYDRANQADAPQPLAAVAEATPLEEAISYLRHWDFSTPTGIQAGYDAGDDPAILKEPTQEEIDASVAATLFSVWRGQAIRRIVDKPLQDLGLGDQLPSGRQAHRALVHQLRTATQRDGRGTSGVLFFQADGIDAAPDARDFLLLAALEDTLELLQGPAFERAFGGSANLADYRWGRLHRITIPHNLGGPFNVPPAGGFTDLAPDLPGLATDGGFESVDTAPHDPRAADDQAFTFGLAPGARTYFVLERPLPDFYAILPGGVTGDPLAPGYGGQIDRWLTNRYERFQTRPLEIFLRAVGWALLVPG